MTKAEKALLEKLQRDLAIAKALRWTDMRPDTIDVASVKASLQYDAVFPAWFFNEYSKSVGEGCFGKINHSLSYTNKTTSQGTGGPWFPSRKDALIALRIALTVSAAKLLAGIDEQIGAEP